MNKFFDGAASFFHSTASQSGSERAFVIASKADEAGSVLPQFIFVDCTFAFSGAQLHFCDEAAKILIAGAGGS
jgi:hypothetical protein